MSEPTPDQSLHLPSLVIKNFRGIDELTIPRLGRVTLLAGKNGVGKTTVLDAVRVWADRGLTDVYDTVLQERGDTFVVTTDERQTIHTDRQALFNGRKHDVDVSISIGPVSSPSAMLRIRPIPRRERYRYGLLSTPTTDHHIDLVRQYGDFRPVPASVAQDLADIRRPASIKCQSLGPNVPPDRMMEQDWNELALSAHEDRALAALNLIADHAVERVAALEPFSDPGTMHPRRLMVKIRDADYQVPLRALGDGAFRTYAVALGLAKYSGGFLLIDEAENGIHHSIQAKFWNMVLQTAQRNNVQVIATTHSWDCVVGFAKAANELEDAEGLLVRIERVPVGLRAITYDETRMKSAAKFGIEVR